MKKRELSKFYNKMTKIFKGGPMKEKLPFEKIERESLIKKEAETSERYGKKPEKRTTEELIKYGIINVNKPDGPT